MLERVDAIAQIRRVRRALQAADKHTSARAGKGLCPERCRLPGCASRTERDSQTADSRAQIGSEGMIGAQLLIGPAFIGEIGRIILPIAAEHLRQIGFFSRDEPITKRETHPKRASGGIQNATRSRRRRRNGIRRTG